MGNLGDGREKEGREVQGRGSMYIVSHASDRSPAPPAQPTALAEDFVCAKNACKIRYVEVWLRFYAVVSTGLYPPLTLSPRMFVSLPYYRATACNLQA